MDWKTLFLSPNGRIAPKPFWIGIGILALLSLVRVVVVLGLTPLPIQIGGLIGWLVVYPAVCVLGKRLHDSGRSAFLIFVPVVLTFVIGMIVTLSILMPTIMDAAMTASANPGAPPPDASAYGPGTPAYDASIHAARISLLPFMVIYGLFALWTGLGRSDPQANRYGPPPAGEAPAPTPTAL